MIDTALRAAKADKPAIGVGLYLEVMPGGSKLWHWKYRMDEWKRGASNIVLIKPDVAA